LGLPNEPCIKTRDSDASDECFTV